MLNRLVAVASATLKFALLSAAGIGAVAPRPAKRDGKVCWLRGGSKASEPIVVQVRWVLVQGSAGRHVRLMCSFPRKAVGRSKAVELT